MKQGDILTPQVAEAIRSHTQNEFPRECAGVVVRAIGEEPIYVRLINCHPKPHLATRYRRIDLQRYWDEALAFVHSHPHTEEHPALNCPSAQDMLAQMNVAKPFVICTSTHESALPPFAWGDQLEPQLGPRPDLPLVERGFHHGITDCYETIRAYEFLRTGEWILQVPRDWAWWEKEGLNLYEDLYPRAGYHPFNPDEIPLEPGDVALMRMGGKKVLAWNHAGVYVGSGLILHHPSDLNTPWSPQKRSRRDTVLELRPFIRQWVRRKKAA